MGMLFVNVDKEDVQYYVNNRGWRRIFRLAIMFGWIPQGTQVYLNSSFKESWDPDDYFTNYGQLVTRRDAISLADAIEWAISMLKEEDPNDKPEEKFGSDWEFEMIRRWHDAMCVGLKNPGYIFFNKSATIMLTECVEFCRHGEFVIY